MADPFQQISVFAVNVLARQAAKKAVKEQMRAEGRRVTLVPPVEIAQKANEYLALNPELYDEARERAQRLKLYDKPKRSVR
jgi:hypothetical protein